MKRLFACADFEKGPLSVAGLPFDENASFRKGASRGPQEIRNASLELETYLPGPGIDLKDLSFSDLGDFSPARIPTLEPGRKYIFLGGDHSVTFHSFGRVRELYPEASYICFDAHADMRESYSGSRDSNACVNRRIAELVGLERISLRGVRTCSREEHEFARDCFGRELGGDVYLSIDLDVLDPSVMPSVGNPEPGGCSFTELISGLEALFEGKGINPVAADVVELAPQGTDNSSITAAKIVQHLIAYMASK